MATPFIVKQGLYANLPTTYTAGTIYVCTDTAEMYIDTTNTKAGRICITNTALEEDLAAITPITKQNITISSWPSNSTYTDFPHRATVSITGVTADMIPEVIFNATDALSGNYAPVSQTYDGGVYIYSKVTTSITVPTIICYPRGTVVS